MKKQGLLSLAFTGPTDYDKVQPTNKIDHVNLSEFAPDKPLKCVLIHQAGAKHDILLNHTLSDGEIVWLRTGSALNRMSEMMLHK